MSLFETLEKLKTGLKAVEEAAQKVYPSHTISLASEALASAGLPLLVYGIVGGKDVGKTTLLNALIGSEVSREEFPGYIAEGTRKPVAYLHRDKQKIFADWMLERGLEATEYLCSLHDNSSLYNVVFLDMPDYDSVYPGHKEICQRLAGKLDRIVCVSIIGKELDRDLEDFLRQADRSERAWILVLNKYDAIPRPSKNPIERLKPDLLEGYRSLGLKDLTEQDIFVLSALQPDRHDFQTLRNRLLRLHPDEELARHKQNEALRQVAGALCKKRDAIGWDKDLERLETLLQGMEQNLRNLFSPEEIQKAERRLLAAGGPQARASAELLRVKVEGYALLPWVVKPLLPLIAWLGGRMTFSQNVGNDALFERIFTFQGRPPKTRITDTLYALTRNVLDLERRFEEGFRLFDEGSIEEAYGEFQGGLERTLKIELDRYIESMPPPGPLLRRLPIAIVGWFVILQPILERWLESAARNDHNATSNTIIQLLYQTVCMLSAGFWLQTLLTVVLVFALMTGWLYARAAREISQRTTLSIREWWADSKTAMLLAGKTLAAAVRKRDGLKDVAKKTAELLALLAEAEGKNP